VSPLSLRRHRAERLLRDEFEGLRGRVLASVRGRLRASGVSLDQADLEACYAEAWQGLYAAVLEGQAIANPSGWLVVVTFRRALDEQRARARAHRAGGLAGAGTNGRAGMVDPELETASGPERDLAAELDDRMRLRQLFEGLRGRLDGREREAATLCYLQGLSRADAAARMGVSEARMRKLMEGRGPGRPGVAGKMGALVETIREGDWCEEQGSLMRALAYGILDPDGERYRLALMHSSQCPACRAYVASLRGLAAVLPPVFLPWGLGASVLAHALEGAHAGGAAGAAGGAGAGVPAAGGASGAASTGGAASGAGAGVSAASGAAGVGGAAGGGWLLTGGPLSAKLAVGCLLALGVGAGCIALEGRHRGPASGHRRHSARRSGVGAGEGTLAAGAVLSRSAAAGGSGVTAALTPRTRASREFGPERALASGGAGAVAGAAPRALSARSASSGSGSSGTVGGSAGVGSSSSEAQDSPGGQASAPSSTADSAAAQREFAPG